MLTGFGLKMWRLAGEVVLQTVPPSLLSAYGATQLAAATGVPFLQCAAFIGLGLLGCLVLTAPVD